MQYTCRKGRQSVPRRQISHLYQPCFLIFNTRLTVALKPILKRFRHLSLCRRFLFLPGRSWNFCLANSFRTWFLVIWMSIDLKARATSKPRWLSTYTVLPSVGPSFMGAGWATGGGPLRLPLGLSESATFLLAFLVVGVLNCAMRSSMLLLGCCCCCSLSAVSWARAGELVLWAFLEAKREVRAEGAVGVPFVMSMALSRMLEMSAMTDVRLAGESGCAGALLRAEAALLLSSSCCLRMEVANDREVEGWARQCLETKATLLAGSLKAMRDCEERIMVSRAFMRSIDRDWQRPEGWGCVCCNNAVQRW
jgi:hypothetical protein